MADNQQAGNQDRQPEENDGDSGLDGLVHQVNPAPSNESTERPPENANDQEYYPSPREFWLPIGEFLQNYWKAPRHKAKWTDSATVLLTFLIAAAAIWSAWIFQGQLTAIQDQTEVSERPWIDVSNLLIVGPLVVTREGDIHVIVHLVAQNIGKTPAHGVLDNYDFSYGFEYSAITKMCNQERKKIPELGYLGQILFSTKFLTENGNKMIQGKVIHPSNAPQVSLLPRSIIGCIQYRSALSDKPYYTGFSYPMIYFKNISPQAPSADHGTVFSVTFDPKSGIAKTEPDGPLSGGRELKIPPDWIHFDPAEISTGAVVK